MGDPNGDCCINELNDSELNFLRYSDIPQKQTKSVWKHSKRGQVQTAGRSGANLETRSTYQRSNENSCAKLKINDSIQIAVQKSINDQLA